MTVVASRVLARKAQPMIQAQRRTFLDWMVNYPDRVSFLGVRCIILRNIFFFWLASSHYVPEADCRFIHHVELSYSQRNILFPLHYFSQINELKKVHQAGGRKIFTWQKQSTDNITSVMIPGALTVIGVSQCVVGFYRLATGTGKL